MFNRKRSYLTVAQKKAILLLADGMKEREVSDLVKVSEFTVKDWQKNNELFKEQLNKTIEEVTAIDSTWRKQRGQLLLMSLYKEVNKRIAEEKFIELSAKDLVKSIALVQHELRLDTPEDVTSKSESRHRTLDDLKNRYKESNSAKMFQESKNEQIEERIYGRRAVRIATKRKKEREKEKYDNSDAEASG